MMDIKTGSPGKHGKAVFFFVALFFLALPAGAQTAQEVETLLATDAVTYAQGVRFVLEASEAAVIADPETAFRYAADHKWLPAKAAAGDEMELSALSLLLMKSFEIKGGILYSLFKNPHYAYRELVYRGVITGRSDPEMKVNGDDLLFMVNHLLVVKETALEANARKLAAEEQARQQAAAEEEARARQRAVLAERINAQLAALAVSNTTAQAAKEGVSITLSNIQFVADSAVLPNQEKVKLAEIAQILKTVPGKILVAGHTAQAGTESGQIRLSLERAQAVAAYLAELGARPAADISVRGYGAQRPLTDNTTPEGMALNRRVEITILED